MKKQRVLPGRRGFLITISGVITGLFMKKSRKLQSCLTALEMEAFERSTPGKHPAITWKREGERIWVHRQTGNRLDPIFGLNDVGASILVSCDGKTTPREISNQVYRKYHTTEINAYQDTLRFLAELKARKVIV
jgi:hypothetical protein